MLGSAVDYQLIVEINGKVVKVTHSNGDSFISAVWIR